MIQLKPTLSYQTICPVCNKKTSLDKVIWQGIHTAAASTCLQCKRQLIHDLPVGQAAMTPYVVCPKKNEIWGEEGPAKKWFGKPFLDSLRKPSKSKPEISVAVLSKRKKVVIVNCLDYLYGHSLLKLLNVERYLKQKKLGVIVIVPSSLSWLVPKNVSEIWTSPVSFSKSQEYYPSLDQSIGQQLKRFTQVMLSSAHSHPLDFSIETFTNQPIHNYTKEFFRITYVWREDRPWFYDFYLSVAARKLGLMKPLIRNQRTKVIQLFRKLKKNIPHAQFTVAGLGKSGKFPKWVDDERVDTFSPQVEKDLVRIYAESRVVIGVHGSNMLLPSAHAGGAVSLVPDDRLSNYAEDLLYQQPKAMLDPRLSAFYYRYLPISTSVDSLSKQVSSMVLSRQKVDRIFLTSHTQV